MRTLLRRAAVFLPLAAFSVLFCGLPSWAQSGTSSATVTGTVTDPTGAVVPGASVIDRREFAEIPLESVSSGLSSLVTLSSPGITADSNGMFHGLGDHAENSFSVDGQPITDQQSKTFSNELRMRRCSRCR